MNIHETPPHEDGHPQIIDGRVVVPENWAILGLSPGRCFPLTGMETVIFENVALHESGMALGPSAAASRASAIHEAVALLATCCVQPE